MFVKYIDLKIITINKLNDKIVDENNNNLHRYFAIYHFRLKK